MRPLSSLVPPQRPESPFGDLSGKLLNPSQPSHSPQDAIGQFGKLMVGEVQSVNKMQLNADGMVHSMLTGKNVNQAEVLTAVQKADLAFRMLLQVRNKLVEAYREVQQIQI